MKKVDKQAVYKAKRAIAKYFIVLGIALNVLGWLIIILNVKSITPFIFLPFWYGYILLADGINYILKKHSLIINQPKHFLLSLILSLIFWGIFEVYNYFIFHGWQYTMPPTPRWIKFTFALLAWATVLPGLLETFTFVETLYTRITGRKILYLPNDPSLIGEIVRGQPDRIITLMISGYICGFLWEFWNAWAGAKWIYTATFLQYKIKIFEMPIEGFLCFWPFATSMYVIWIFSKVLLRVKE